MTKKYVQISLVILMAVFFSGCSLLPKVNQDVEQEVQMNGLEEKNQVFEISGTVSQTPTGYIVTTPAGKITAIESYSVDFASFVGSSVTLSGEYSGDTFFVTKVE